MTWRNRYWLNRKNSQIITHLIQARLDLFEAGFGSTDVLRQ
jgi:hypothetical protein